MSVTEGEKLWNNLEQAQARLNGSIVMYNDIPHWLTDVTRRDEGEPITGRILQCGTTDARGRKVPLTDPLFKQFTQMYKTSFVNIVYGDSLKVQLIRRLPANIMKKGLSRQNCEILGFLSSGGLSTRGAIYSLEDISAMEGFVTCQQGLFPVACEVLPTLQEEESCAVSQTLAIYATRIGFKILLDFMGECIGVFLDDKSLKLLPKYDYRFEEVSSLETMQGIDIS